MLDHFDMNDGLRRILNVVSTQRNFAPNAGPPSASTTSGNVPVANVSENPNPAVGPAPADPIVPPDNDNSEDDEDDEDEDEPDNVNHPASETISDEEQLMTRQAIRHVACNLKRYFECHLTFVGEKLKRTDLLMKNGATICRQILPYKAVHMPSDNDELRELHTTVMTLMPKLLHNKDSSVAWSPVDRFVKLNGIQTLIQAIALAYDWNYYSGRAETVKTTLDALAVCCLVPKVQHLLTERFNLNTGEQGNSNSTYGLSIILSAAEGEVVMGDPDVQKSALQVLGNCVCGPVMEEKKGFANVWECVRVNNGILVLTRLLFTKTPITDADSIRSLACWCLSGLTRYKPVTQVLEQLPLIRAGLIQNLMREPILQEKRVDHVQFQKHALEILKLVRGKDNNNANSRGRGEGAAGENNLLQDYMGDLMMKSDLISQTKIVYNEQQLLELIHEHLLSKGYVKTANALKSEVNLENRGTPKRLAIATAGSITPSLHRLGSNTSVNNPPTTPVTPSVANNSTRKIILNRSISNRDMFSSSGACTPPQASSSNGHLNCSGILLSPSASASALLCSSPVSSVGGGKLESMQKGGLIGGGSSNALPITLDSMVKEYLLNQHALCKTPMVTCPAFDLFKPHKCPSLNDNQATRIMNQRHVPTNVASRLQKGEMGFWTKRSNPNRRWTYSKFRPFR